MELEVILLPFPNNTVWKSWVFTFPFGVTFYLVVVEGHFQKRQLQPITNPPYWFFDHLWEKKKNKNDSTSIRLIGNPSWQSVKNELIMTPLVSIERLST